MKQSIAVLGFIIGTVMMILFYSYEIPLFIIMSSMTVGALAFDRWKNVKRFFVAMLIGGMCENLAVFLGAWSYTNADYIFTPLWLPVGWGMSVILLEEAFAKKVNVEFCKKSILFAFGGTYFTATLFAEELKVLLLFAGVTIAFFLAGYYKREEIKIGLMAALFGTVMESSCIIAGNWHYSAAMLGTPLWLPFCWFNAFLIMRRIIRIGE